MQPFLNSFASSNVLVRKRTQYDEIEFLCCCYTRISTDATYNRDHNYFGSDGNLEVSGFGYGKTREKDSLVRTLNVHFAHRHSPIVMNVMIKRVTLASSRRHRAELRLLAVARPKKKKYPPCNLTFSFPFTSTVHTHV